ncbi:MAG: gamma-glutamyl-gamma-aminobutyrate hydrolase family protein, partial [Spirochaetaceae bacterium]|nr:gamma-glutamyl-gamma-aminobutyrate hydrolase family protein [Spirochaetaceae bacterium]
MIVLIDNYDSFTHNLYQYLRELTDEPVTVIRNDRTTIAEIGRLDPSRIVISPGPGRPEEAGISVELIREFAGRKPILGVCLGHQAIAHAFGARIVPAGRIVHGKAEPITLDGHGLFRSIASPSVFTRYHSLAVDPDSLPAELEVTARSEDGEIMGIRHTEHVVEGVQFHPESMASEAGKKLLANFLHYRREPFVTSAVLSSLIGGGTLSRNEAANFMEELTEGNLSA